MIITLLRLTRQKTRYVACVAGVTEGEGERGSRTREKNGGWGLKLTIVFPYGVINAA